MLHISPDILSFLTELKANNNREWFNDNKSKYQSARENFEQFIEAFIPHVAAFDSSIGNPSAKSCIYRIYRDTRFSANKTPYKEHFAAFLATGGNKQLGKTGYYIHLEPQASILGGGIYMPIPEDLKLIRTEIYYHTEEFKNIVKNKEFVKYYNAIWDDQKLKTAPKGFPKDFPDIDLLKYKNYSSLHFFDNKVALQDNFMDYSIKVLKATQELNNFINRALSFKE